MGPDVAHKLERFVCRRCNWWRIVALIEPNGGSPPSRRRMFALPLSGRNSKWSDPFFFPLSFPSLHCQQLWPSPPSARQRLLKDVRISWQCTSRLPSHRRWLPRCERSGCGADTWWRGGIDGAGNDEEMRAADGQAAKTSVSLFFFFLLWAGGGGWNSNWNAKKGGGEGGEVIDNRDEAICAAVGAAVVHQNTRAVN